MRIRPYGVGLCLALVVGVLTGCSPGLAGGISVTVDDAGRLVAVMEKCRGDIEYVSLSEISEGSEAQGSERVRLGEWTIGKLKDGSHALNLETGNPAWKASSPWQPLKPGTSYVVGAWDENQSWTLGTLTFKVADLAKVKPGEVLSVDFVDGKTVTLAEPLEKFKKAACGG
ncbi:hypothetical protein OG394_15290 [Kribbella sp. NBC_01245]|uniref:hypothetical protein n=1 Tax=Kribbella sp. NBC_01245 TaxID=2903578 RepID=UPI002E28AD6B|nr:hypothetical protein [Kribbella sp. NBC_01245]